MAVRDHSSSEHMQRIALQNLSNRTARALADQDELLELYDELTMSLWDKQDEEPTEILEVQAGNSWMDEWNIDERARRLQRLDGAGHCSTMPNRHALLISAVNHGHYKKNDSTKLVKGPAYNPFRTHSVPRQRYIESPHGRTLIQIDGIGTPVPRSLDLYQVVFESFNNPDDSKERPSLEQLDASHTWSQMSIASAENLFVIDCILRLVLKTEAMPQLDFIVSEFFGNDYPKGREPEVKVSLSPLYGDDQSSKPVQSSFDDADVPYPCTVFLDMENVVSATLEQVSRCSAFAGSSVDYELVKGRINLLLSSYSVIQEVAGSSSGIDAGITFHFEPAADAKEGVRTIRAIAEKHHDYISFSELNLVQRENDPIVLKPRYYQQGSELVFDRFCSIKYEVDPKTPAPWLRWDPTANAFKGMLPVTKTFQESPPEPLFDDKSPLGPQHCGRRMGSQMITIIIRATLLKRHYKSELRLKRLVRARLTLETVPWWINLGDKPYPWLWPSQKITNSQTIACHESTAASRVRPWNIEFHAPSATLPRNPRIPSTVLERKVSGSTERRTSIQKADVQPKPPADLEIGLEDRCKLLFSSKKEPQFVLQRKSKGATQECGVKTVAQGSRSQNSSEHSREVPKQDDKADQIKTYVPMGSANRFLKRKHEGDSDSDTNRKSVPRDYFHYVEHSPLSSSSESSGAEDHILKARTPLPSPNVSAAILHGEALHQLNSSTQRSKSISSGEVTAYGSSSSSGSSSEDCGCRILPTQSRFAELAGPVSKPSGSSNPSPVAESSVSAEKSSTTARNPQVVNLWDYDTWADHYMHRTTADALPGNAGFVPVRSGPFPSRPLNIDSELLNAGVKEYSTQHSEKKAQSRASGDHMYKSTAKLPMDDLGTVPVHSTALPRRPPDMDVESTMARMKEYYNELLEVKERGRSSDEMTLGMESDSSMSSVGSLTDEEPSDEVNLLINNSGADVSDDTNNQACVSQLTSAISKLSVNPPETATPRDDRISVNRQSSQSVDTPLSKFSSDSSSEEDESGLEINYEGDHEGSDTETTTRNINKATSDNPRKWTLTEGGRRLVYRYERPANYYTASIRGVKSLGRRSRRHRRTRILFPGDE